MKKDDTSYTILTTNICFDQSITELFVPLLHGGTQFWASSILDIRFHSAASFCVTTPSVFLSLRGVWPKTLRALVVGGEPCPRALIDLLYSDLPLLRGVWNSFGPTEVTDMCCFPELKSGQEVSAGPPLSNVQLWVLDEALKPVGLNCPGQLAVTGHGVAQGYTREAETDHSFVWLELAGARRRTYLTGDIVHWRQDGHLIHHGRNDETMKVNGVRISRDDIQQAALSCPGVAECAVLVRENVSATGDVVSSILCIVSPKDADTKAVFQCIKAVLTNSLASVTTVQSIATFPRNSNGKLDVAALGSQTAHAVTNSLSARDNPASSAETVLYVKELLCDVCSQGDELDVCLDTEITTLGLTSMSLYLLYVRLSQRARTTFTFLEFFGATTIADVCRLIA